MFLAACGNSNEATTEAETQTTQELTTVSGEISPGLDIDLFLDGALDEEATVQDCTLADGTETTCYAITVAGFPANDDVGPFCPETTTTDAEDAGIWFDGNGLYDADGEFILGLADLYNDSNWKLYNDDSSVKITDTPEAFEAAARPDVDPAYQNHCVEGRMEWLKNGEPVPSSVMIPTTPVVAQSTTPARGNLGVTLNGVVIAAPAPVDAILGAYTIAAFDDCGGHINPVEGYHLHGARGCSEVGEAVDGETPIFAYAMDGYAIHSPLSEEATAAVNLDECNGHTTDELGYHYHAAPAEDNGVLTCLKGVTVEAAAGGRGPGPGPGPDNEAGPPPR
ncbi:MAG: YHYH protein [Phormidesmis sp.]